MESSRRLIILLVAGVVVAFAAIAIKSRLSEEPAVDAGPVTPRVLVAKRDLPPGSFVQAGVDIDWDMVPDDMPKDDLLLENAVRVEDFSGAVVRKQLRAGEPVSQSALMKAGEGGFMSAVLEPGMRAVSIKVNETSGNAGFISPGDRVDLIVTHRIKSAGGGGESGGGRDAVISETFVRDVRVLAVDQMLDNPENKAILAKTVTVEVNDQQAEQIAVATEMGKISMSLRSMSSGEVKDTTAITRSTEMDVSKQVGGVILPQVRVIRGDQVENLEFSQ